MHTANLWLHFVGVVVLIVAMQVTIRGAIRTAWVTGTEAQRSKLGNWVFGVVLFTAWYIVWMQR